MDLPWELDELDRLTLDARAFTIKELDLEPADYKALDDTIWSRETIAALLGLVSASYTSCLLWPDDLVKQFRDLREKFCLEEEFDEFMEGQEENRAKLAADEAAES
ncbi:hypothetical protein [Pseudoglutamicibacter cumminsii]|uniref:Uncharacterized protein n=1 Tax=Pseudoglutamicibacter cumminsii TaxID=156979 RepID=A0ABX5L5I6_9MICC|nr:hypothetical protein [Pseudoglutamicibacter cumminsii]PWI28041.1 hypothetical protein CAY35_04835 [Pseudoglutamicibacter cumminsii]